MKTPVAFLPGPLTTEALWSPVIERLAGRIEPWVADLTADDSIAAMATRVLADAPWQRFALAGHSLGGYVAFEIMRRSPERIERLALVDTQARSDTLDAIDRRRALIELAQSGRFPEVVERLIPVVFDSVEVVDPALVALHREMARAVGAEAFLRQQRAIMERVDSRPILPSIRCPTLVLCGVHDLLTPLDRHEEMAAAIPGTKLVAVPSAGHYSPLERPYEVGFGLANWLDA
ncbi:MAG TPA: alpha/beta fold hydrolase [Burkholderiales bacterium]|nr:alpha/beta fold hydrolase [Burkholderiales bacterium]